MKRRKNPEWILRKQYFFHHRHAPVTQKSSNIQTQTTPSCYFWCQPILEKPAHNTARGQYVGVVYGRLQSVNLWTVERLQVRNRVFRSNRICYSRQTSSTNQTVTLLLLQLFSDPITRITPPTTRKIQHCRHRIFVLWEKLFLGYIVASDMRIWITNIRFV